MNENNVKLQGLKQEIINLEAKLGSNTSEIGDYKIIKCYEATLTNAEAPYDIAELTAKRQEVRHKIAAIEEEIAKLEEEIAE